MDSKPASDDVPTATSQSWIDQTVALLQRLMHDIWTSPINLILVGLIVFLLVKLFLLKQKKPVDRSDVPKPPVQLPKMPKGDLTVDELRGYNGTDSNGRILTVIYGDIFDVSRRSDLYGPGQCPDALRASRALNFIQEDRIHCSLDEMQHEPCRRCN